jgi:hypothetical protein
MEVEWQLPLRHEANPTMNFQIDVTSSQTPAPVNTAASVATAESLEVLRQILEVQREQLAYQKAAAQAHDLSSRWRAFLGRWKEEFPGLSEACRKALPALERSYGQLIVELTDHLNTEDGTALDNDFGLQEFLDRYGMRLAQLGTILNLVGPLADAGMGSES